jgi:hypothetical protein
VLAAVLGHVLVYRRLRHEAQTAARAPLASAPTLGMSR